MISMLSPDPQFGRSDVLRAFNHVQIYLFLGAAIITVGIVSAFFALLRRRFDSLVFWFALFALIYGARLEMDYQLLWTLGLRPPGFQRVVAAFGFLIPIPAFFFFRALNLIGRAGEIVFTICWPIFFARSLRLTGRDLLSPSESHRHTRERVERPMLAVTYSLTYSPEDDQRIPNEKVG